jgi:hypothetical protein
MSAANDGDVVNFTHKKILPQRGDLNEKGV